MILKVQDIIFRVSCRFDEMEIDLEKDCWVIFTLEFMLFLDSEFGYRKIQIF